MLSISSAKKLVKAYTVTDHSPGKTGKTTREIDVFSLDHEQVTVITYSMLRLIHYGHLKRKFRPVRALCLENKDD